MISVAFQRKLGSNSSTAGTRISSVTADHFSIHCVKELKFKNELEMCQ